MLNCVLKKRHVQEADRGMPAPDVVIGLELAPDAAANRGGYGGEAYENVDFQNKARTFSMQPCMEECMLCAVCCRGLHSLDASPHMHVLLGVAGFSSHLEDDAAVILCISACRR